MTKMYLQSFVTFTRNEVRGTYLVFQKRRFQGFISEILRVVDDRPPLPQSRGKCIDIFPHSFQILIFVCPKRGANYIQMQKIKAYSKKYS